MKTNSKSHNGEKFKDIFAGYEDVIDSIADALNKRDECLMANARQQVRISTIAWLEGQAELLQHQEYTGSLSDWTRELAARLKSH